MSDSRLTQALKIGVAGVSAVVSLPLRLFTDPFLTELLYTPSEMSSDPDEEDDAVVISSQVMDSLSRGTSPTAPAAPVRPVLTTLSRRWSSPNLSSISEPDCISDSISDSISHRISDRICDASDSRLSQTTQWAWGNGVGSSMLATLDKVVDVVIPDLFFSEDGEERSCNQYTPHSNQRPCSR